MPSSSRTPPDPLRDLRHLTPRDRLLLSWLAEHHVLTTGQIAVALFPSLRAAQKRLTLLHRIGAVARFEWARTDDDIGFGLRYTLGPLGDLIHPGGRGRRSLLAWRAELARNPKLNHLLGVNGFFTSLHGHARTHPRERLLRWWGETRATGVYALAGIHPDGHGIWQADGRTVGFFVEHDRGTENIRVVLAKLPGYQRLAVAGPRYPVLLHVPDPSREASLQRALADLRPTIPVATAVHGPNPAEPVWTLAGAGGPRLRLHQLPSSHGPEGISNPHRFDQDHQT
jgi:hypothetical protein